MARTADAFPSYPWIPPDAVRLETYEEILEVLRNPSFVTEPRVVDAPFKEGALNAINGPEHLQRRRTMNRLLRGDAVDEYRETILRPSLREQMLRLAERPDPDGHYRADLVVLTRTSFIPVLAGLVGMHVPYERSARLLELLALMRAGADARFGLAESEVLTERALAAKHEFQSQYYEPATAKCPVRPHEDLGTGRTDLMSLMAARVDPHWEDDGLRLRETIGLMLAFGGTVTMITYAVDDLCAWLPTHPEDRALLSDLGFLTRAMTESLRLHPLAPVTRIATADVTLSSGTVVRKGQWVIGSKLAADHDDRVFGPHADRYDPHRELPVGLAPYALAFGAGAHQCIGLGLILGTTGVGVAAEALRVYFAAGVEPDRSRSPKDLGTLKTGFSSYPALFRDPSAGATAAT